MTTKFELMNYITKPLIGGSLMYAYTILADGKKVSDNSAMWDAGLFALSTFSAKLAYDILLCNTDKLNESTFVGMSAQPVITAFIYTYLYTSVYETRFNQRNNRSWNANFALAAIINVVTTYAHNPLLAFFTGSRLF